NLISGNAGSGIHLTAGADGNFILNNLVGTDKTGTGKGANGSQGVLIQGGSRNVIGGSLPDLRNVVSGNAGNGVEIAGGDNNMVLGNYIGTDVTGTAAVGNGVVGLYINGASSTKVRDNVVSANGRATLPLSGGILIGYVAASAGLGPTQGTVL